MNKVSWSHPTNADEVARRAGGRRLYNSVRQLQANLRRFEVAEMMLGYDVDEHGTQAKVARRLGVSQSTIGRDVKWLLANNRGGFCHECRRWQYG